MIIQLVFDKMEEKNVKKNAYVQEYTFKEICMYMHDETIPPPFKTLWTHP